MPIILDKENIETAVSSYVFMIGRSFSEQHFIFRQIVKDMLSCSLSYPKDEAIRQLAYSLTANRKSDCNNDELTLLYECYSASHSQSAKEAFIDALQNGNIVFLQSIISAIPKATDIYNTFPVFCPSRKTEDKEVVYNELIEKVTRKTNIINLKGLNTRKWQDTSWCFTPLGYLSVFENWLNCEEEENPYDYYFYNLYFRGKVIDFVVETIFQCDVTAISHRLLMALVRHSQGNEFFSKCVNRRYEYYRTIHPGIPERHFDYFSSSDTEEQMSIKALDPFRDRYNVSDEKLKVLYDKFNNVFFECSLKTFLNLFSGDKTSIIIWTESVAKLAAFLKAYSNYVTTISYNEICKRAVSIFYIKSNGKFKPTTINSLLKPNEDSVNLFDKKFEGIIKNKL